MAPYLIAAGIIVVILFSGLRIAQEYQRGVVYRLGRYAGLRGPGLYWIIPLAIERSVTIDVRTRTVSAEQQETITRDSVTVKVNAVLWYRIVDAANPSARPTGLKKQPSNSDWYRPSVPAVAQGERHRMTSNWTYPLCL